MSKIMYVSIFRAVMMNCLGVFFMLTAACVAGISVFAFYADRGCDPLANKDIKNPNQVSRQHRSDPWIICSSNIEVVSVGKQLSPKSYIQYNYI